MKKKFITEVVLKKLEGILNEVGEFNYNKRFTPTYIVAKRAQEALSHVQSEDLTISGTEEGSGKQKAAELEEKKNTII